MALNRYKLGYLIEQIQETNVDLIYGKKDVMGMTITKQIIPTKADTSGADLKKYIIIKPNEFVYNPRTHGKKIGLGFNDTTKTIIISWNNIGFRIKHNKLNIIDPYYLYINFNRNEWDREACYQSWGSSTEVFSWYALCDMDIELPSIEIQRKYVAIYKAMLENQKNYEKGLDDLKLACDAYIEEKIINYEELGKFIKINEKRNVGRILSAKDIKGFDVNGDFIKPARLFSGDIKTFKIISKGDFVYNPRIPTITYPVALNNSDKELLVSPAYATFYIEDKEKLDEEYLIMILQRKSFSRKVLFNTWGSSTPFLRHDDLCDIKIPLPSIDIQKSLARLYKSYNNRRLLNEKLKEQIKNICPILIKGSLEEAKR